MTATVVVIGKPKRATKKKRDNIATQQDGGNEEQSPGAVGKRHKTLAGLPEEKKKSFFQEQATRAAQVRQDLEDEIKTSNDIAMLLVVHACCVCCNSF